MFQKILLIIARRLFRHWVKLTSRDIQLEPRTQKFVTDIMRVAADIRLYKLEQDVLEDTGGVVAAGFFKGMKIDTQVSWGHGEIAPKLLGCYEEELMPSLDSLKDQPFDAVINVGSAEGYYAVGAALSLKTNKVIAVDIDQAALDATKRNAARNNVADKVETLNGLDGDGLIALMNDMPTSLVIADCEGFEMELFTPGAVSALRGSHVLIECHDFIGTDVAAAMQARFEGSHDVQIIREGPRDPNAHALLRNWDNLDRWLTVCEFRPETMRWVFASPRQEPTTS